MDNSPAKCNGVRGPIRLSKSLQCGMVPRGIASRRGVHVRQFCRDESAEHKDGTWERKPRATIEEKHLQTERGPLKKTAGRKTAKGA
jgi:hypothetical protein